jgi:hypothetical protein
MQWSRDLCDFHLDSHPVYSALTLVTPGRATLKRRSPISHPGDTHRKLLTAHKPHAGELVVGWVTTSESSLLYVFRLFYF